MEPELRLACKGQCLNFLLGKATSQLLQELEGGLGHTCQPQALPTVPPLLWGQQGAANEFSSEDHTPGRKGKAALGIAGPASEDSGEARGGGSGGGSFTPCHNGDSSFLFGLEM